MIKHHKKCLNIIKNDYFSQLHVNNKYLILTGNKKMKSMTIVAFGLLVLVAIAVAKPGEPKEDEGDLATEVGEGILAASADKQSKLIYRGQNVITVIAPLD